MGTISGNNFNSKASKEGKFTFLLSKSDAFKNFFKHGSKRKETVSGV